MRGTLFLTLLVTNCGIDCIRTVVNIGGIDPQHLDTSFETEIRGPEILSELKISEHTQYLRERLGTEGSSLEYHI